MNDFIEITGAKEHNLKDLSVKIPKNKLVVITGLSGSGKSSLAFDTLYAEGQRRYLESFSASYAQQFFLSVKRPEVEKITALSPVVAIKQKTIHRNLRSTVGTITEIYDFMRLLFAKIADAYSFAGHKMTAYTEEEIVRQITRNYQQKDICILAPLVRGRKGHYRELFEQYRKKGFLKVRIDNTITELYEGLFVDRYKIHNIELIVDNLNVSNQNKQRLSDSLHQAIDLSKGLVFITDSEQTTPYSLRLICPETGLSYETPSPNSFSFNSPLGYCPSCKGLGASYETNIKLLIQPECSIKEGGIIPYGKQSPQKKDTALYQLLKKYQIPDNIPIQELPEKKLDLILYGDKGKHKGIAELIEQSFKNNGSEKSLHQWASEFMTLTPCSACNGDRLKKESLHFLIEKKNIAELSRLNLQELYDWFVFLPEILTPRKKIISKEILQEITDRLSFLLEIGLDYLKLSLSADTLSGGEAQRIRLATQIGAQLKGITYILDEPSIGLHQRDNHRLIQSLKRLRDLGNSVLVVEHDRDIMCAADYIIDMGPGAGNAGGHIIAEGTPDYFLTQAQTPTALFLKAAQEKKIFPRKKDNGQKITLTGAQGHNLKNISVSFPLGTLIVVTGVSGSGKSSLITHTLYPALLEKTQKIKKKCLSYEYISGTEHINKVIEIDQSPIGRIPRSNPATYCGFFTDIRTLYAALPASKIRAYKIGRFSFNVAGGRCEDCQGAGFKTIEMGILPAAHVPCATCAAKRYNRETLDIRYKGKSISDVLHMSVDEALVFFNAIPQIHRKIKTLQEVGLGYLPLGHSALFLSGGEAQRVKLSTELSKKDTKKTFYILDEPTTGLHFQDIALLMQVLKKLVDKGNTVLIIEHNMDVIALADYIIDMGIEGGAGGGLVVASGLPEEICGVRKSVTGKYLKEVLQIQ